jgi:hypothetical protein
MSLPLGSIVGFSINDMYYLNPNVCNVETEKTNCSSDSGNTASATIASASKCSCTYNKQISSKITSRLKEYETMKTDTNRYNQSLETYNRELLRTVNYLAGIGMLCAYIYVNTI